MARNFMCTKTDPVVETKPVSCAVFSLTAHMRSTA